MGSDSKDQPQIEVIPYNSLVESRNKYDLDGIIFDLNSQIKMLSSGADKLDYLVSVASGLLCGALDVLWVGEFSLERGRAIASEKVEGIVKRTAKLFGCKKDDLPSAVKYLEDKFPIPADGNTPDFGGGLQHHLRDFAHHPTLLGLICSLLTQFTGKSYGTDVNGRFIIVEVPAKSRMFIGKDVPTKILYGTIIWFFHLISDMAGSSGTVGKGGGTGIPGPILALAKELSALPFFKNMKVGDHSFSEFLSKLFNGTLLAKHDESGAIIKESVMKLDLRGELGIGIELGRQAIPVIANECIVRAFYFIRRFAMEMLDNNVRTLKDMERIHWDKVKPANNPTIARMLTIATGVFTTVDVAEAVISGKYWVSVNFVGVARFAVAIGQDVAWCLKARPIKQLKQMYEIIDRNTFTQKDKSMYERIAGDMSIDKFSLTTEQVEILYNLEYYKINNDIRGTKLLFNTDRVKQLKQEWLNEWKTYMTGGFASFLQVSNAKLHWYSMDELRQKIAQNDPQGIWFRLVLLEAMLFEPYYPLSVEKDGKGNDVPSKKYKSLQDPIAGYKKEMGDAYLNSLFTDNSYYTTGYIKRLRNCHNKVLLELNKVENVMISLFTVAGIVIVNVATAGIFAPVMAVSLVGSSFVGLHGAALASACLAYFGGGAMAAGGLGTNSGAVAIVGGGAILCPGIGAGIGGAALGLGAAASVGGAVGAAIFAGKKNIVLQTAKLLVSVREIFLIDEHDLAYSNSVYKKYVQEIVDIEKALVELRLKKDQASDKEKKALEEKLKRAEESVKAMKLARDSMKKVISSYQGGMAQ